MDEIYGRVSEAGHYLVKSPDDLRIELRPGTFFDFFPDIFGIHFRLIAPVARQGIVKHPQPQ